MKHTVKIAPNENNTRIELCMPLNGREIKPNTTMLMTLHATERADLNTLVHTIRELKTNAVRSMAVAAMLYPSIAALPQSPSRTTSAIVNHLESHLTILLSVKYWKFLFVQLDLEKLVDAEMFQQLQAKYCDTQNQNTPEFSEENLTALVAKLNNYWIGTDIESQINQHAHMFAVKVKKDEVEFVLNKTTGTTYEIGHKLVKKGTLLEQWKCQIVSLLSLDNHIHVLSDGCDEIIQPDYTVTLVYTGSENMRLILTGRAAALYHQTASA